MNVTVPQYIPIIRLCAIKDRELPYGKKNLNTSDRVVEWTRELIRNADREYLLVVPVDAKMKPVGIEVVAIGKVNEVGVDVKNIFKYAMLSNAIGVIIIHNHPSGEPEPSIEDIHFTKRLIEAGKLLDVEVIDHLVITDEDDISMKDKTELWN